MYINLLYSSIFDALEYQDGTGSYSVELNRHFTILEQRESCWNNISCLNRAKCHRFLNSS